ncbi:serine hydrolase [Rubrolithibacter danxiaensis]|uniref:serine hydrolase n=1 Tax=Rubrolithibacter danxiaensis TaxID=3390805 RepID=UPI003BF89654
MKKIFFLSLLFLAAFTSKAQERTDQKLTAKLRQLTKGFNGDVGIYVKNLKTGFSASLNADSIFPTASMIKIPIMVAITEKVEKGELNYHQLLTYSDSLLYPGEDILGSFKDGEKIKLSKVQMLSITTSDNTASIWLQKIAGGENINNWLEKNGFEHTRINSRVPGREPDREKYGWGQTTPKEMATLLTMIRQGKAINAAASERMYRNLIRIYWDEEALSQIPPYVQVASKQGALDQSRSEVVLVNAPHGDYVFCIDIKNMKDTSWTPDNEGWTLIRNLSRLLWNYYEPNYGWKPAEGIEKYRK